MSEISEVVLTKQIQQNRQSFLSQTFQLMTQNLSADVLLQSIVDLLHDNFHLSCCVLLKQRTSIENRNYYISRATQNSQEFLDSFRSIVRDEFSTECTFLHGCQFTEDLDEIEKIKAQSLVEVAAEIACKYPLQPLPLLIMPLVYRDRLYGNLVLYRQHTNLSWQDVEINEIRCVATQCGVILDRQRLEGKNQKQQIRIEELESKQQNQQQETVKRKLFIDNLTHELRTPISSVLGFSRSLIEEIFGDLNPKQKQYVNAIYESGKHLLDLVNDYLDLSKIDADRENLVIERILVEDICQASLLMVEGLASQENTELILEIDAEIGFCFADSTRLKQILVNLLSNAIKFTEKGTVTLKVRLQGDYLEFSVIDTGIGISEEDCHKLFEPFQQLSNQVNRRKKGTGLGLVLSQKLARLHGGDLTMTSTVGKGSCFTVHLPLSKRLESIDRDG
jgi:signal transduction histidine kinase